MAMTEERLATGSDAPDREPNIAARRKPKIGAVNFARPAFEQCSTKNFLELDLGAITEVQLFQLVGVYSIHPARSPACIQYTIYLASGLYTISSRPAI